MISCKITDLLVLQQKPSFFGQPTGATCSVQKNIAPLQVCDDGMDSGQEEGSSGADEDNVYGITTALNLNQHRVRSSLNLLDQHFGSILPAEGFS